MREVYNRHVLGTDLMEVITQCLLDAMNGGWREIESAPRDGTVIIVYNSSPHKSYRKQDISAAFCLENGNWYLDGSCGCNDDMIIPTHWMHLPQAPEKGES